MRPLRRASVLLAPVLVTLSVAPAPAFAASPSPSPSGPSARTPAIKRVAKRADAAYVLPAPALKEEALPPLPPAPPSTSLPPSSPPAVAASPVAVAPDADRVTTAKELKPTGAVLQLGAGMLAPTNAFARGLTTLGPGVAFELRAGGYLTPHFGILVGVRGSYGHSRSCDGCGKGWSVQVPLMLQFAQKDRSRGLYGELGLGIATTYGASGDDFSYTISAPVELKVGLGYRLAGPNGEGKSATLDLNMGMDIGEMKNVKGRAGGKSYDGAIDDATTHVVTSLSLISHFSL